MEVMYNKNKEAKEILLIEDDSFTKKIMSKILNNYNVPEELIKSSINGKKAFDYCLNNSNIKLIFLDLIMPNYNGVWFLKKVLEKKSEGNGFLKKAKIMLASGSKLEELITDEKELSEIKELITDYLPKPYDFKKVKELLKEYY